MAMSVYTDTCRFVCNSYELELYAPPLGCPHTRPSPVTWLSEAPTLTLFRTSRFFFRVALLLPWEKLRKREPMGSALKYALCLIRVSLVLL